MCGILAIISKNKLDIKKCNESLKKIQHRGPDDTSILCLDNETNNYNKYFGFVRLKIMDLSDSGNQPFHINDYILICNGEIYNYKELIEKYEFQDIYQSDHNDCEVIIHMYHRFGIERTIKELDGVFAFCLYDIVKNKYYVARDPIGIRPLFMAQIDDGWAFASEMKALIGLNPSNIKQFPVGTYFDIFENKFNQFYSFNYQILDESEEYFIEKTRDILIEGIRKRLMSDRKIACLLSGGLDSTIVTAVVAKLLGPKNVNTYSIGLKGSVDLKYAQIAADYFGTNHTSIEVTEDEFLQAIPHVIYQIESYDTTSVRASVGNYLVSQYIGKNSDDVVITCGDVADEIFGSYYGFCSAPNDIAFQQENVKMLRNINFFDVLRSDRTISSPGLESRVPFADKALMNLVMSMPPKYKMFGKNRVEKHILREAFKDILPPEIYERKKCAFSDGVSVNARPWYKVIQEYIDKIYDDPLYQENMNKYEFNCPYSKESLYYREVFEKYYGGYDNVIPYFWVHPFSDQMEPSAWTLDEEENIHATDQSQNVPC